MYKTALKKTLPVPFSLSVIALGFLLLRLTINPSLRAQEGKSPGYEVSVNALCVPFIAIDSQGNPVQDLSEEEIELVIDGKKTPILYLSCLPIGNIETVSPTPAPKTEDNTKPQTAPPPQPVRAAKFLVIDVVFSTQKGITYSKKLAKKMIENGTPNDSFVLLKIELGGLRYLGGPNATKDELIARLDKINNNPQRLSTWAPSEKDYISSGLHQDRPYHLYGIQNAKENSVLMYKDAFTQLENALRTITTPKVTYLFTEGFAGELFTTSRLTQHMMDLNDRVHNGGSLFKNVQVGYLKEKNLQPLANSLSRSVSAYYELFFTPNTKIGHNLKISIKSKRKGVSIDAAGYREKDKPYQKLDLIQKKLFAISVVTGMSWSEYLGSVETTPFKEIEKKSVNNETQVVFEIKIPKEMQNKEIDIFAVRLTKNAKDADIGFKNLKTKNEWEILSIQTKGEKTFLYFVIVDPATSKTVFNRVL